MKVANRTTKDIDNFPAGLFWFLALTSLLAIGLSIAALATSSSSNKNNGGGGGGDSTCNSRCFDQNKEANRASFYDNTKQAISGINIWTNIDYAYNVFISTSWLHIPGTNSFTCMKSGKYFIYLSVQTEVEQVVLLTKKEEVKRSSPKIDDNKKGDNDNENLAPKSPPISYNLTGACHPCKVKFAIRGTQQFGGVGLLTEIVESLTYSSKEDSFLSKLFFINASVGDVFRMQFKSSCPHLILSPFFNNTNVFNSYPSSTTMSIF
jgi:hypothetical protein